MDGIINFSEFYKSNSSRAFEGITFDENSFEQSADEVDEYDSDEITVPEPIPGSDTDMNYDTNPDEIENYMDDDYEQEIDQFIPEKEKEFNEGYYSVFKDKAEIFSCDIALEGASLTDTQARLVLESPEWTLQFVGTIDSSGKCQIPIKKLSIFNEGVRGKIRLEVIADGSVFTPWEDEFKVKVGKKVSVKIHESKSNPIRKQSGGIKIQNVRKR